MSAPIAAEPRKLHRDPSKAVVGGVCAGLAEYMNVDVTVVRVVAALLVVFTFFAALFAYLLMWAIVPVKPAAPVTPPYAPPVQQP